MVEYVYRYQNLMYCSYSVSIVMYISGAKFGGQLTNASWDILDSVLYCFSGTIYDVITFLICITQKRNISKTKEDIPKWKTPFLILKRL